MVYIHHSQQMLKLTLASFCMQEVKVKYLSIKYLYFQRSIQLLIVKLKSKASILAVQCHDYLLFYVNFEYNIKKLT